MLDRSIIRRRDCRVDGGDSVETDSWPGSSDMLYELDFVTGSSAKFLLLLLNPFERRTVLKDIWVAAGGCCCLGNSDDAVKSGDGGVENCSLIVILVEVVLGALLGSLIIVVLW